MCFGEYVNGDEWVESPPQEFADAVLAMLHVYS